MPVAIPEIRECINCTALGPLTVNGRCSTCGSDAVVPLREVPEKETDAVQTLRGHRATSGGGFPAKSAEAMHRIRTTMSDHPSKLPVKPAQSPRIKWELDGRHTHILFKLASERAEEQIQKYRLRLIEFDRFDPQPQRFDPSTGRFGHFDNNTRKDRIEELERWIATYEAVVRFCLKMEAAVSQYEAEQFGEQMAQMFGGKAK